MVLDAFAGVPAVETLSMLRPYLSTPGLKEKASSAAVTISERIVGSQPAAVAEAMEAVLEATGNKDLEKRARRLLARARRRG